MNSLDVRRLAAVDMHGIAGTSRRRQLIRAEFLAGAICGAGLIMGTVFTGVAVVALPDAEVAAEQSVRAA